MNQWLLLILVFAVGASLTRLITSDKLLAPLRDRFQEYWSWRAVEVLMASSASALVHNADYRQGESVQQMKVEIYRRAYLGDAKWRQVARQLDWFDAYRAFLGCPWCVGMWVYLGTLLTAWLVVLGPMWTVWGGPWWVTIPSLTLAFRWLYGLIASNLDS